MKIVSFAHFSKNLYAPTILRPCVCKSGLSLLFTHGNTRDTVQKQTKKQAKYMQSNLRA